MSVLRMKGVRVASLAEFRKNFDFTNAKDYLRQGRLSRWVRELGESELADELDELKDADYSDQTLLDNFVGIFELPQKNAVLPETAAPSEKQDAPPAVPEHDSEKPSILVSPVEHPEECAYADTPVCFRDSRMLTADQSVTMFNVKGNTLADLHQYMNNKMVLKTIRQLLLSGLPEDLHEKSGYQIEITADSKFIDDLGLDDLQLAQLVHQLKDRFTNLFIIVSNGKIYHHNDCHEGPFGFLMGPNPGAKGAATVGELLDLIKAFSVRLKSYSDDEAKQLLKDGF